MERSILILLLVQVDQQLLEASAMSINHDYEVVFPQILHSVYKEQGKDKYPTLVQYELHVKGKPVVIHMEKNENLISDNYTEIRYLQDDTPVMTTAEDHIQDHCHYHGYVEGDEDSLVSISTCSGMRGFILTGGRSFLIEPLNPSDNGEHAVFEAEMDIPKTCGVMASEDAHKNMPLSTDIDQEILDSLMNSQKYVEICIVADESMFEAYDRNIKHVRNKIFGIVNYINLIYKVINIYLAVRCVEFWETKDQIEVSSNAGQTLELFAKWNKQNLLSRVHHDNAQLITRVNFNGATDGMAYVNTMCSSDVSAGIIQDFDIFSPFVGATLAHKMCHNHGMDPERVRCSCPHGECIMTSMLRNKIPDHFSIYSLAQLRTFILDYKPVCVMNKPDKKTTVCRNNFIELGEDCDCGTVKECINPCCNAATCKLQVAATCTGGDCCENCQIKKAGTLCRPSSSDGCDYPATCNGRSNVCPRNQPKPNGVSCKNDQGYCFNGSCPTLIDQCTYLWGPDAVVAEPFCFNVNSRGTSYGHCNDVDGRYIPCRPEDIMCGVLYCSGGYSEPTVNSCVVSFYRCKAVLSPIGMVQNGTKCGDERVCYNGKCLSVDVTFGQR